VGKVVTEDFKIPSIYKGSRPATGGSLLTGVTREGELSSRKKVINKRKRTGRASSPVYLSCFSRDHIQIAREEKGRLRTAKNRRPNGENMRRLAISSAGPGIFPSTASRNGVEKSCSPRVLGTSFPLACRANAGPGRRQRIFFTHKWGTKGTKSVAQKRLPGPKCYADHQVLNRWEIKGLKVRQAKSKPQFYSLVSTVQERKDKNEAGARQHRD